jgi:hypothetical protein
MLAIAVAVCAIVCICLIRVTSVIQLRSNVAIAVKRCKQESE